MALEYRTVAQERDVKIVSRAYLWQDEARLPSVSGYDPARVLQIYGTDESVDRHNTKLRVDGWDFTDYRKNPAFLWAHNMDPAVSSMPLGRVIGIQREEFSRGEDGAVGKRLLFDVEFPKRGVYPFADLACDMYKEGHLRASSVGFRNLKMRRLDLKEDREEMEKGGYDLKAGFAADLTHNALLELSAVPVGSNPNALAKAMRTLAPADVQGLLDHDEATAGEITDAWIATRFDALRAALTPAAPEAAPDEVEEAVEADVVVEEAAAPASDLEAEIERALAGLLEPPPAPAPDPADFYTKHELRQLFDGLAEQLKTLTAEVKSLRDGAAPGAGLAPALPVEPAPSHLDLIVEENAESFARLATLFPR